jgi:hypothetical protein
MAVKAINDITSPNRLIFTLLVYGAYPRINNLNPFAPFITKQIITIQKMMAEIVKL